MARGRPPAGPKLTKRLEGSDDAKQRMRVILETINNQCSVADACEILGISKTAFHELRNRVLQAGLGSLEPKPKGRPRKQTPEQQSEMDELKADNLSLQRELRAAQIREELALTMPHVLNSQKKKRKKTGTANKKRGRRGLGHATPPTAGARRGT